MPPLGGKSFKRQRPGTPIAARTINRPIEAVERASRNSVSATMAGMQMAGGFQTRLGVVPGTRRAVVASGGITAGIPSGDGIKAGVGMADFRAFDGTTFVVGRTAVPAYNPHEFPIPQGATVWLVRENGFWVVEFIDLVPVILTTGIGAGTSSTPASATASLLKPASSGPGFASSGTTATVYNGFSSTASSGKFGWCAKCGEFLYLVAWDC